MTGLIHVSQVEATDPGRSYDPLAQAVLLASQDPLAEETKSRAPDAAGLIVARDGMPIPLTLKPMEAEPVDDLPRGKGWLYEPKYDGFRCIAFRDSDKVDLQSKKQKSLNRFFPEVAAGHAGLEAERFVPDGVGR